MPQLRIPASPGGQHLHSEFLAIPMPTALTDSPPPPGGPLETTPPRGWGDTGTDRVVIVRNGTPAFTHNILTGNPDFRMIFYDTPKGVFNQE